jgi:aminoglycoside phosphotransferase family enzyme
MDIASLKRALLNPEIYPDHPGEVGFVETHISLVFLTGTHAYKIKKPVNFGFLDFTSLAKRKHFCEEEVRLNRRLAEDLYLGVVTITQQQGRLGLDGPGETVEHAVKMKQIAEERLFDRLLAKKRVTPGMIEAVAAKLVNFYATAETSERIRSFARPQRVKQDTDENFDQTEKYVGQTISPAVFSEVKRRTNDFFRAEEDLFYGRIASDRIRDCHGDLRLEHIFWAEKIAVIDCIEFNERFRYTDVAADIGFLAMDLDHHEREDLSEHLIRSYAERSGDEEIRRILDFYKCYRAYVRGKVESFRLDDSNIPEKEKEGARKRAQQYFSLSHRYAQKF